MIDEEVNHSRQQHLSAGTATVGGNTPGGHVAASVLLIAIAAAVGLWPTAAESKQTSPRVAIPAATTADDGGVGPGTNPPPVPGVKPMDPASGWVFPIREANRMAGVSSWTLDQGVDLGFGIGFSRGFCGSRATLVAVEDAVVTTVGLNGFGSQSPVLRISRGPYKDRQVYYGHSQPTLVRKGQSVKRGQAISHIGCGIVGHSSAPHLEFGLMRKGQTYCCPSRGETSNEVYALLRRMWPAAVAAAKKLS